MRLSIKSLQANVLILQICGFPLVAAFSHMLGASSTPFSIFLRLSIAFIAILILLFSAFRLRLPGSSRDLALSCFYWFWLVYLLRVFVDTFFWGDLLSRQVSDYWFWAVGGCLLPALSLIYGQGSGYINSARVLIYRIGFIVAVFVAFFGGTTLVVSSGAVVDVGRLGLTSLNPISTGHLGCSVLLMGIFGIYRRDINKTFGWLMIFFGAYLLLGSASRGPLLSFLVCFFVLALKARASIFSLFILFLLAVGVISVWPGVDSILMRLVGVYDGSDLSAYGRYVSYFGAVNQFLEGPIFGSFIEERLTGSYPHNIFLEGLMAVGLLGGVPLFLVMISSLRSAIAFIDKNCSFGWVGLLFVQYLIGAQFSGSLYSVTALWALLGVVLNIRARNYSAMRRST